MQAEIVAENPEETKFIRNLFLLIVKMMYAKNCIMQCF